MIALNRIPARTSHAEQTLSTQIKQRLATDANGRHELANDPAIRQGHVLHVVSKTTACNGGVIWEQDGRGLICSMICRVLLGIPWRMVHI